MYRCKNCKKVSKPYDTQFRLVTKIKPLLKGFEIEEEIVLCKDCYNAKKMVLKI